MDHGSKTGATSTAQAVMICCGRCDQREETKCPFNGSSSLAQPCAALRSLARGKPSVASARSWACIEDNLFRDERKAFIAIIGVTIP